MIDAILEFLIYAIFPYLKKKKRKKEEWYGIVEEKKIEGDYSLKKHRYAVVFRTSEDKKRKLHVSEALFNQYEKGKQYRKRSGEDFPESLS